MGHILYYGDCYLLGDYMVTDLEQRMEKLGLDMEANMSTFEDWVTENQIEEYDLPTSPN